MLLNDDVVKLVPLDSTHVDFIAAVRSNWENYQFFFDFHLASREQELEWIQRVTHDPDQANFVIVPANMPDEPAGTISLTSIDRRSRNAEYGRIYLDPKHRGSGMMRRASQLVLCFGFCELNLHKIYLRVFADNQPAIRLYRELGFKDEGTLHQQVYKDGVYRDVNYMALFADAVPCGQ